MKKIILDTDFIITALKNKIHILEQLKDLLDIKYQVYIIDKTISELKNKPQENLAKLFIKKLKIIKTKGNHKVDCYLLKQKNAIIATQDRELKRKLKELKISIITIRQKKYLKLF